MNADQAGNFLICTILLGAGFTLIGVTVLIINNLFSKYWQPLKWMENYMPPKFIDSVEPHIEEPAVTK